MATKDEKDAVSKLMGQYLLKGFTLLDQYCAECRVMPMMKSKNESAFCVYCKNVRQAPEKTPTPKEDTNSTRPTGTIADSSKAVTDSKPLPNNGSVDGAIDAIIEATTNKLLWSSSSLKESSDIGQIRQLNELALSLMETLKYAIQFKNSLK